MAMKAYYAVLLALVLGVGCGDPNEKANELYVEAVKLISSAEEKTGESAIKDYEKALANLRKIVDDYSKSDLAVKLVSNETLFTGKSLKDIETRVKQLKRAVRNNPVLQTAAPARNVTSQTNSIAINRPAAHGPNANGTAPVPSKRDP